MYKILLTNKKKTIFIQFGTKYWFDLGQRSLTTSWGENISIWWYWWMMLFQYWLNSSILTLFWFEVPIENTVINVEWQNIDTMSHSHSIY